MRSNWVAVAYRLQRRQTAVVALDDDDAIGPLDQQRPRQATGPRPDLDDGPPL
jgi:hypothetical protein